MKSYLIYPFYISLYESDTKSLLSTKLNKKKKIPRLFVQQDQLNCCQWLRAHTWNCEAE